MLVDLAASTEDQTAIKALIEQLVVPGGEATNSPMCNPSMKILDDKRQSTNLRNHFLGNSVGDACRWNIYFQLLDTPETYSSYGHARMGRDGQCHPKPYWEATPFGDAGGIRQWLDQNKSLTYVGMRIKCPQWLLEKEKAIGACDAVS